MRKKKGFTLIELIIVIAIIGVLIGVLIPSWSYYMKRARTRSQNFKAKAIFNAAQTIATDLKFSERINYNALIDAYESGNASQATLAKARLYGEFATSTSTESEWCFYWDGKNGKLLDVSDFKTESAKNTTWKKKNKMIADSINRIVNDENLVYKVYVKNYKVVSVVSARSTNDRYLGTYPRTLDEIDNDNTSTLNVNSIRAGKIMNADMNNFAL